jgi:Flp pilus assembly protein TadG
MLIQIKKTRKHRTRQRGALTVEFALTLPVLLLLLFGAYELGRANMLRNTADAAAYEGARRGIVPGAKSDDIRDSVNFILATAGIRESTIRITPANIDSNTQNVLVEIDVPMAGNTLMPSFFTGEIAFRGRCQLNRELVGFSGN